MTQEKEYSEQKGEQVQWPEGRSVFDVFREQLGIQSDWSEMNEGESGY